MLQKVLVREVPVIVLVESTCYRRFEMLGVSNLEISFFKKGCQITDTNHMPCCVPRLQIVAMQQIVAITNCCYATNYFLQNCC